MKKVCIRLIRFYQKHLSKLKGHGTCIFYPTCSQYDIEAYEKYGITDENGEILKVDLRSYREQNKERPEDEHLIPTLHIGYRKKKDKASQEEVHEIIQYNENAKKIMKILSY